MTITDADIASFATEVSTGFTKAQQSEARRRNARDRHVAPGLAAKVAPLLYTAAHEAASAIARQAGSDTTLAERRTSYRYSSGIKGVTVSLTLMVAAPTQLWIAEHNDGQLASLQGYSYEAVETKGKFFTTGLKIESKGTSVRITAPKATAAWINEVRPHTA
jgi:hypothetical protein